MKSQDFVMVNDTNKAKYFHEPHLNVNELENTQNA